jgi:Dockerin type I domain
MFGSRIRRRSEFHQVKRTVRRWARLRLDRLEDRTVPATITWDGGPTGQGTNWLDRVNWVGDVLPGFNDDVVIGPLAGGPTVVTLTTGLGSVQPHNLTVTGATLRLDRATLVAQGDVTNSGTIELTGLTSVDRYILGSAGPITNSPGGTIRVLSGLLGGRIDNQGTITVVFQAYWFNGGASFNAGTIDVTGTLTLDQSVTSFVNTGAVTVKAGGTFTVTGGLYTQAGGTTSVAGTMTVSGPYTQTGGTTTVAGTMTVNGDFGQSGGETTVISTMTVNGAFGQSGGSTKVGHSLTVNGAFDQSGGTIGVALNGPIPGTEYGQIIVNGTVNFGGATLSPVLFPGFIPPVGTTFTIIDNDGTDPVTGTFAGLPQGAVLSTGGQSFSISYAGGTGNDVVLTRSAFAAPAQVVSAVVNAGQADLTQRSVVTDVTVTFDRVVGFAGAPEAAFRLTRTGPGGALGDVALAVDLSGSTATQTVARLTFGGPLTEGSAAAPSLSDGRYTLTVFGGQAQGGDYVATLLRLFGDVNGDAVVNGTDLTAFRGAFGANSLDASYLAAFDWNGDGAINGTDLTQFRNRFGVILP